MTDFSVSAVDADAIAQHALRDFPNEACGVLLPAGYRALPNRHPDPAMHFDCADDVGNLLIASDPAKRVVAVVHSHVARNPGPSANDMTQQMAMDLPWGIVLTDGSSCRPPWFWGDMLPPPPLVGRKFRHGPSGTDGRGDCYALIRDWYRMELGILLVEGPRDDNWWVSGGDLYLKNFARAGFSDSPDGARDPRRGDVMLIHEFGPVPAHAGVYVGMGLFMHHLANRLSRREPTGPYLPAVVRWLRHERVRAS